MGFRIVGPGIRPDFISGPASIPGFPDAYPLLSPRHANPFLVLALTGGAAVTGGAQAKSILAAVAGAVTGGRIAVDKEVFYQNTFPALVQRMKKLRDKQRDIIESKLKSQSDDEYPLGMAYT